MYQGYGIVTRGVGGLFTVKLYGKGSRYLPHDHTPQPLDGLAVSARGRGNLHKRGALLVGDRVRISYDDTSFSRAPSGEIIPSPDGTSIAVEEILPRRCALIRPPMANLDVLYVTAAAATPDPVPETLDKLLCIAEFNGIDPVLIVTKGDCDKEMSERLARVYRRAGFPVFEVVSPTGEGIEALQEDIRTRTAHKIAAFSGASGVGKSTLLNRLFPHLNLETGDLSHRIERGKNTTRTVELYPLSEDTDCGYLADTPGFTMLDFERFDFMGKEDLVGTFREFAPYIGACRYKKCTHTKEEGCAILEAVKERAIPRTRHRSYVGLFNILKDKHDWDK